MTIASPDIIRITARLQAGSVDDVQNVFHVQIINAGALSETQKRSDLRFWLETVMSGLVPFIHQDVTFDAIDYFNESTGNPEGSNEWIVWSNGGQVVDEKLPNQLAGYVSLQTGISKRNGGKFFGVFTEADNVNGFMSPALVNALVATGLSLINPYTGPNGLQFLPGIYSRVDNTLYSITSVLVSNTWANLKKRRPGIGS